MPPTNLKRLAEMIRLRQEDLMTLWRNKARQVPASQRLDTPTLDSVREVFMLGILQDRH